jgi:hypothetical protein
MVTRLYFLAQLETMPGNGIAPATVTSVLNSDPSGFVPPRFLLRMDTTMGSSALGFVPSKINDVTVNPGTQAYCIEWFVSPLLNQNNIKAGRWNYAFGAWETAQKPDPDTTPLLGYFPVTGRGKSVWVNLYAWRPSTGTKYGTIWDGETYPNVNNDYPHNIGDSFFHITAFDGKAVHGLIPGDTVLIMEVWFIVTFDQPTHVISYSFVCSGTTVPANDTNVPGNDYASYLESQQSLSFITTNLVARTPASAESVSIGDTAARLVKRNSGLPLTETVSITDSVDWRRPSHPYNKVIGMNQETVTIGDSANRTITRAVPLNKTARLQDEDLHISEDVSCQATTGAPTHTGDPGYFVT